MSHFDPRPLLTVSPTFRPFPTQVNSLLDFRGTELPSQSDYLFLHNRVGIYPTAGPHMILREPSFMNSHTEQLTNDINKAVPANFDGMIIIDYSVWSPLWSLTRNDCERSDGAEEGCGDYDDKDHDFQDDWEEAWKFVDPDKVRNWREQGEAHYYKMLASTYNQTARDFFMQTIRVIRDERPNAKIGFLGHVFGPYNKDGSENANWRQDNSDLKWLHEACDIVVPRFYFELERSIDGEDGILLSDYRKLIRENSAAAWRFAMDLNKEVRPFFPLQYSNQADQHFGKMLFSPVLQVALDEAYSQSCHGCFIWYGLASQKNVDDIQAYLRDRLAPVVQQLDDGIYFEPEDKYEQIIESESATAQQAEVHEGSALSVTSATTTTSVDERLSEGEESLPASESYTASEEFSAFFGKEGITFTIPYEAIRRHFN